MNLKLLREIVEGWEADPHRHNQDSVAIENEKSLCGMSMCLAGDAMIYSGKARIVQTIGDGAYIEYLSGYEGDAEDAAEALGIPVRMMERLFYQSNEKVKAWAYHCLAINDLALPIGYTP